MKKGDKVICLIDYPGIPGAKNLTKPVQFETYTVKALGQLYHPQLGRYLPTILLEEIDNSKVDLTGTGYSNMFGQSEFPFAADYFKTVL